DPALAGMATQAQGAEPALGTRRSGACTASRNMAAAQSSLFSVWLPDARHLRAYPVLQLEPDRACRNLRVHPRFRPGNWPPLWRQDLVQLFLSDLGYPKHLHRPRRSSRFEGPPHVDSGQPIDVSSPGPTGDQSICVGCTTNCPDVDL